MQSLLELQRSFALDLLDFRSNKLGELLAADCVAPDRRFNIYRNNYRSTLSRALAQIYPVIKDLVGGEFFDCLAKRYTAEHPSIHGNLHEFGDVFAHYISRLESVAHLPYLADVARLEWAYHCVFHAPASKPFDSDFFEDLSEREFYEMRFVLGPSCRLIRSPFPVFEIWRMHQHEIDTDVALDFDRGPDTVLVVRQHAEVELQRINAECAVFLEILLSGEALRMALDSVMSAAPDIDWLVLFVDYVRSGVLLSVSGSD